MLKSVFPTAALLLATVALQAAEPITSSIGMKFVLIEAGSFTMGQDRPASVYFFTKHQNEMNLADYDKRPAHRATISQAFHLGTTATSSSATPSAISKETKNHYYWPICIMAADVETYGETEAPGGYRRARDILIARNGLEHCDQRIAAGIYAGKAYPLLPKNIRVADNVFTDAIGTGASDFLANDPGGELAGELRESSDHFEL